MRCAQTTSGQVHRPYEYRRLKQDYFAERGQVLAFLTSLTGTYQGEPLK